MLYCYSNIDFICFFWNFFEKFIKILKSIIRMLAIGTIIIVLLYPQRWWGKRDAPNTCRWSVTGPNQ